MKISNIKAWILHLPVEFPLLEPRTSRNNVLVEVETEDGLTGYALSGCHLPRQVRDFLIRDVDGLLKGMDPRLTEGIRKRLLWEIGKRPFGVWAEATSLVDVALWDLKGKQCGQAVWRLLGGAQNPVPAYITFGLPDYDRDQLVEVARMLVDSGQDKLKMVVGRLLTGQVEAARRIGTDTDLKEDAARVRAVRDAVGEDVQLMIDANCSFNGSQALRMAKLVEDYDITWFEDPIYGADVRQLRELREGTTIPVAAGSTGTESLQRIRDLVAGQAVDILQPNVRDIGGFTEGLKAAGRAQAFNLPIAQGGSWPHMNMHLQAGVMNGTYVEFHWGGWKLADTVFEGIPGPVKGMVTVPDGPGLGIALREGVIRAYESRDE